MLFPDDAPGPMSSKPPRKQHFNNWSADPGEGSSYNFGPPDKIVQAIQESGAAVYYRIGRSAGSNLEPPMDCNNRFAYRYAL